MARKKHCGVSTYGLLLVDLSLKSYFVIPQIPGYARKMDNGGWSYSTEAVTLLQDFMTRFPMMFLFLSKNSGTDKYYESDLFPGSDG